MLRNTFLHIDRIGRERERKIWKSGIKTWDEYIEKQHILPDSLRRKSMKEQVEKSIEALEREEHNFFEKRLPGGEKWRAYKTCESTACFLDIETTGLFPEIDDITVIGIYDCREGYRSYIKDINMNDFLTEIQRYKAIITFNGGFDRRFIHHHTPEAKIYEKLHIDLRPTISRLGYKCGLKEAEQHLGIRRPPIIQHLRGIDAVRLWRQYRRGNKEALDLLIEYNKVDVTNMKTIIEATYSRLKEAALAGL